MSELPPEDRRLVALAAVFAPARAEALASRLLDGRPGILPEAAARAARGTRSARIATLRVELLALPEAAGDGTPEHGRPAFRRLLRERAGRG